MNFAEMMAFVDESKFIWAVGISPYLLAGICWSIQIMTEENALKLVESRVYSIVSSVVTSTLIGCGRACRDVAGWLVAIDCWLHQ